MRSILFDSPISRAGYVYATAVGFVWGAIWSTGRIRREGGLIVFRGMPAQTGRVRSGSSCSASGTFALFARRDTGWLVIDPTMANDQVPSSCLQAGRGSRPAT